MKGALLAAGVVGAGLAAFAFARGKTTSADSAERRNRLTAIARASLLEPGDAAEIVELESERIVFQHHAEVLERRMLPGSVMKLATAYGILEAKRAEETVRCTGTHVDRFGTERGCWLRDGHGDVRLRTAIALSCNVWFYEQASHLLPEDLLRAMALFGLDPPPSPILPDRDLPDAAVGDRPGLEVTPRALLTMTARIANRGRDAPELRPEYLDQIAEGMAEAVRSGTLAEVFKGLDVAAKTGTAKKEGSAKTRAIVVGFLPRIGPKLAFIVVKDHGRGAHDAGPPAAALLRALLE